MALNMSTIFTKSLINKIGVLLIITGIILLLIYFTTLSSRFIAYLDVLISVGLIITGVYMTRV